MLAVLALVAAACGDDDTAASDDSSSADDVDPDGVARFVMNLAGNASFSTLDPIAMPSPAYPSTHLLIYDTLLRERAGGVYEPALALSAEVLDSQTIEVELRPDLKFTDGTPLDAAAVKFSVERNRDSENFRAFAAEIAVLESVEVIDSLTLRFNLSEPVAGAWYPYLARGETLIVSPTAVANGVDLNTEPVGAGPYMLESLTMEQSMRFVKNPDYWDADNVRIPTAEYVHAADPTALTNALVSGAADIADDITSVTGDALAGTDIFVDVIAHDNAHLWSPLCKSQPPLDNIQVRQALNFAVDRDALNQAVFNGAGVPMYSLMPPGDFLYDSKFDDFYEFDLDKARSLLADAGYPDGFTLDFFVFPGENTRVSEVIQASWAEIGVEVGLRASGNILDEFFNTREDTAGEGLFFTLKRGGLDKITRSFIPGGSGNVCQDVNQPLIDIVDELRATALNTPEYKALWTQATDIVIGEALNIFVLFVPVREAYSTKFGDVEYTTNFQGLPFVWLPDLYVKAG